jgi:putative FmdB family regulatory protein
MPIRDFRCRKCKYDFEILYLSFSEEEREKANLECPKCGHKKVEKKMSASTSFILKGSGYYSTDYKKKR